MSLVDVVLAVALVGMLLGVAVIAVSRGLAVSSDPQDLEYWLSTEDGDVSAGTEPSEGQD